MILRLRADQAGLDALPFEAIKPAHITAAVAEWQRTGHTLPTAIDLWDDESKWIRVTHPKNGAAFLLITGRLDQAGEVWSWLERQRQYSDDLRATIADAVGSCMPERKRPALVWVAPE